MLKITIQSHRFDEPAVQWILDMLKFKQVRFKKHVIMLPNRDRGKSDYETTIEKVEIDNG